MPGYTKNMYLKDLDSIKKEFSNYIKKIECTLPNEYDFELIVKLIEKFYPYEWNILNEKYNYYLAKEKSLILKNKKSRYSMPEPKNIIKNLSIIKKILSKEYSDNYKLNFDNEKKLNSEKKLNFERLPKINKVKIKIDKAKLKAQEIEPFYIDKLMGLYDKKRTTQKDKVYIFLELEKYYCPKVITFFKKKVDTEFNRQLREMAFYHLQSFKHYVPSLRKQKYMRIPSKNKKRRKYLKEVYAKEKFNIQAIPKELEYRINNSKEQKLKEYDFFISHSSLDYEEVQSMIKDLNNKNKNVYCDWINDTDYLKRKLIGESTKKVIDKRLEQSKNILFIKSEASIQSNWVKYELNYFSSLGKKIFVINKDDIINSKYQYSLNDELWYVDEHYKEIILYDDNNELN